jgi:hypothetical protein
MGYNTTTSHIEETRGHTHAWAQAGAQGHPTNHLLLQNQLLGEVLHVADVLQTAQARRDELGVGVVLAHGVHEHRGTTVICQ